MPRMWMTCPNRMCDKHLLGEHHELHVFAGLIRAGRSVEGYIENNLLEPEKIASRHAQLVKEMQRRGMNHRSPLLAPVINDGRKINRQFAMQELLRRCPKCRKRFYSSIKKGGSHED